MQRNQIMSLTMAFTAAVLSGTQPLIAQSGPAVVTTAPSGTVVVSDNSNRQVNLKDNLQDRITLIDGTSLVGKITEMNASRVIIKVAGQDLVVEPNKIERVERNILFDPDAEKRRAVEVKTKDGSRYRGSISRADATTTYVQTANGEVPVRNDNVEKIDYLDVEKVRQADAIAARPKKWELTLKGGSMLYQLGTFKDLLSPGYFGLLQVEAPHFLLPWNLRLSPGLQAGYVRNSGKSVSTTKIDLFPGVLTMALSRQLGTLPLDIFVQGNVGVNLTRGIQANANEKLSLDFAYGAELGAKYHLNEMINFRLAGIWHAVSESTATLNHLGAYASVGLMF
ncbi:MAG TPA: hypothetical protein PKD60_16060 [Turneriella sp.]|nr:hypothetical protein [Turneriella sp.]